MSNSDFRITTDALDHPKLVKLKRLTGDAGIICLFRLWGFTARYHPKGDLDAMTDEDIEIAAKWDGHPGDFFRALITLKLLDETLGLYAIHDWSEHNAYAFYAPERSEKAKHAAQVREQRKIDKQSSRRSSIRSSRRSSPSPNPSPNPNPIPSPKSSANAGPPSPPAHLVEFVQEILPDCKPEHVEKQAHALELLTADMAFVDKSVAIHAREGVVLDCLRWMRKDRETRGNWKGWDAVFRSIVRLRENGCEKFKNAYASWRRSTALDPDDPQYKRAGGMSQKDYDLYSRLAKQAGVQDG